jgi:penicillin-insensitive murein DD-endopeptidase
LQRAASEESVERIFVNPAIKKALCDATSTDADRAWLHKIRAYWGHDFHFHMRIACPKSSPACKPRAPLPSDDGCGSEPSDWLALVKKSPRSGPVNTPRAGRQITLDQLPAECRTVLEGPAANAE